MEITQRLRGVAVGAAVGDALGMPLEFDEASPPGQMIRDMRPGRLPAGCFTDDTEMALALAESLIARRQLDPKDLSAHFLDWYKRRPPDVGIHTSHVLQRIARGETWQTAVANVQKRYPESAGNGSLMRGWPVAVMCWQDKEKLLAWSREQSQVTHAHEECAAGCVFINSMIARLLAGDTPLDAYNYSVRHVQIPEELLQVIRLAPHRKRDELRNTGWVRHTIESATWGLLNSDSFEDTLIQVINLGEDADTAGTVAGALAGAAYGLDAIPDDWKDKLQGKWPLKSQKIWRLDDFTALADQLAGSLDSSPRHSISD